MKQHDYLEADPHVICLTFVLTTKLFTIFSPMPLDAPVTTNTAFSSSFLFFDSSSNEDEFGGFKFTSGNTGCPLKDGGSGGSNDDVEKNRLVRPKLE